MNNHGAETTDDTKDILTQAAENFVRLTKKEYVFTMGTADKSKVSLTFMGCKDEEFTHIYGLDHLTDVQELSDLKNVSKKKAVLNKILNKAITLDSLQKSSKKLMEKLPKTYNPETKGEYTIYERIVSLSNMEKVLDRLKEGKSLLFEWDKRKCNVRLPNGQIRRLVINANYLLKIPGDNGANYFAFLCLEKNVFEPENIRLKIISMFQDGVDVSKGQQKPRPILQIDKYKVNGKTKVLEENLYVRPSYKKQLTEEADGMAGREKINA